MKTYKTRELAEQHLKQSGWKLRSTSGHYLNDNVPGYTKSIIKLYPVNTAVTNGDWTISMP